MRIPKAPLTNRFVNQLNGELTEEERNNYLLDSLLGEIVEARANSSAFFSFVMREETTQRKIATLPHQRVALEFIERYPRVLLRMPVGFSKTYITASESMRLLGNNPSSRGALISSTAQQAEKPFRLVKQYIETSAELRAVYPNLQPNPRDDEPWTQHAICVDRPIGIRDPSLVAIGEGGKLPGSRLNYIVVDDILNLENTATKDSRDKVKKWFAIDVLSRRDINGTKVIVCNTPYVGPSKSNPDDLGDLTYVLEASGWPTLTMNCWGAIYITNAPDFDSIEIRPSNIDENHEEHRLTAHDNYEAIEIEYPNQPLPDNKIDVEEVVPLWPEKFSRAALKALQSSGDFTAAEFAQLYEVNARDESATDVKIEWFNRAKLQGQEIGLYQFESKSKGPHIVYATGVDLAFSKKRKAARSSILTLGYYPDIRKCAIVDINVGKWSGKELIANVKDVYQRFGGIIRVENNAAQEFVRQWINEDESCIPTNGHTTGVNKLDPKHGIQSILILLENGGLIVPNDPLLRNQQNPFGTSPIFINELFEEIDRYDPKRHTGDIFMSLWFAYEQLRMQGTFNNGHTKISLLGQQALYR